MRITGVDHLVLNVADARRSLGFYVDVLGLEPVRLAEWEAGDAPFVSVRVSPDTILDLMEMDRTGDNVDHFCLVVDGDVEQLVADLGLEVDFGPAQLFGARGNGTSVYVRDPDGNRVELRSYA